MPTLQTRPPRPPVFCGRGKSKNRHLRFAESSRLMTISPSNQETHISSTMADLPPSLSSDDEVPPEEESDDDQVDEDFQFGGILVSHQGLSLRSPDRTS